MESTSLTPDSEAQDLSETMADATETMQTILRETLESAEDGQILESGRTTCGPDSELRGPLDRFPTAVELQECPVGLAGAWHTHVTPSQLLHPHLSLPDMATVAFGHLDVMMVVGSKSADTLVAADDREAMVAAFQDALGVEVESVADVVAARQEVTDASEARRRVREALGPLLRTVETGFPDITDTVSAARDRMDSASVAASAPDPTLYAQYGQDDGDAQDSSGSTEPSPSLEDAGLMDKHNAKLRARSRSVAAMPREAMRGINTRELIISTVVGNVVGNLIDNYVFNE